MATASPAREPVVSLSPNVHAFAAVAERLEAALDLESDALQQNKSCDLGEICQQKRQGLLELSRIVPRMTSVSDQYEARDRLGRLAIKLERNRMALDIQLRAVREVADIIARTMREAESDGTYSKLSSRP